MSWWSSQTRYFRTKSWLTLMPRSVHEIVVRARPKWSVTTCIVSPCASRFGRRLVFLITGGHIFVQQSERFKYGDRGEMSASEPADLTLNAALLVGAVDARGAEERVIANGIATR